MAKGSVSSDLLVGWREDVGLPDLGFETIKAKVDTGARTSALHASVDRIFEIDGRPFVEFFTFKPNGKIGEKHCLPLVEQRDVKNTSGVPETRCVIKTTLVIGKRHWLIEVTLTDREQMAFDLILGRTALRTHHICVHPGKSFLAGPPLYRTKPTPSPS
jgi:hypothetical protein